MLPVRLVRGLFLLKPRLPQIAVAERRIDTWWSNTLRLMKDRDRDFDLVPQPERHRREWNDWNYDCEIYAFGKRLKEELPMEKLKQVFIDQSYVDSEAIKKRDLGIEDIGIGLQSNKELANKGHEILRKFVTSYLRTCFPRVPEEGIQSILNDLCSYKTLSHLSEYIGCKELIISPLVNPTDEMMMNALCSLIAVLEESNGSHHCQKFILDFVVPSLHDKDLLAIWEPKEPELKVRQILRRDNLPDCEPRLLRSSGCNTIYACYQVGLYVDKNLIGQGPGETVEVAREMAAYDALRRFFHLTVPKVMLKLGPAAYNLDYSSGKDQPNPSLSEWRLSQFNEPTNNVEERPSTDKVAISM